jgi:molecular chaperone IbpA
MKQHYLTSLDIPNLHRVSLGFDRIFEELNRSFANSVNNTYPPYNVIRRDDTHYAIEVAIAGFKENELNVEIKDGTLVISGQRSEEENEVTPNYVHRGISGRSFVRTFRLTDTMEVKNANVKDGILTVEVEDVIPAEEKPQKIQITFQK